MEVSLQEHQSGFFAGATCGLILFFRIFVMIHEQNFCSYDFYIVFAAKMGFDGNEKMKVSNKNHNQRFFYPAHFQLFQFFLLHEL